MHRTAVLNIVGLTSRHIGSSTPSIKEFLSRGSLVNIQSSFPAVTCTAQANYVTGRPPAEHGIVGNGWYHREMAEVQFWKQPEALVARPKLWDLLKQDNADFSCAKLFWWYNMYSTADYSITPRPMYPADGRKVFDIYSLPYSIRHEIKQDLGAFPFMNFWGPASGIQSSAWIAESAKWIEERYHPTLSLVYLPHLDYGMQKLGPLHPEIHTDLKQIDEVVGDLIRFFESRNIQVILLSEYGITEVEHPIHLNRIFREKGWLAIKDELGLELLDCGASKVFAVADHQVAHIYLNDPSLGTQVQDVLSQVPGLETILDETGKEQHSINHPRSGDLVAIADSDSWFTYYYWKEDQKAPDFARCVDIHRKPGYDPVELFLNPSLSLPKLRIAWKLFLKKIGMRMLMDLIPLDAELVKGSHGRQNSQAEDQPLLILPGKSSFQSKTIESTQVMQVLKESILEGIRIDTERAKP